MMSDEWSPEFFWVFEPPTAIVLMRGCCFSDVSKLLPEKGVGEVHGEIWGDGKRGMSDFVSNIRDGSVCIVWGGMSKLIPEEECDETDEIANEGTTVGTTIGEELFCFTLSAYKKLRVWAM